METQLRDRRRGLHVRRDAFSRIQHAEDELERRIAQVQTQQLHLQQVIERIAEAVDGLCNLTATLPRADASAAGADAAPRLELVHSTANQASRGAA